MRLIDGDALKDRFDNLAYDDWNQGVSTSWADAFKESADIVEDAPTIEPEHPNGEWIPAFNGRFTGGAYWFSCSKCSRIVPEVRNGGWNYCPNCGAKMEVEE